MTFAIVAIVVLVVIVLFVLMSRKPEEGAKAPGEKKPAAVEAKPKSIKPGAAAPSKVSEPPAAEAAEGAAVAAAPGVPRPRSAPPPTRDLTELRKGLAKARGAMDLLLRPGEHLHGVLGLHPGAAAG